MSDALRQQLSIRRWFYPPGEIWSRLETFLIVMTGVAGEAKAATKLSTMYKTAPSSATKNHSDQNVSTEVKKSWSKFPVPGIPDMQRSVSECRLFLSESKVPSSLLCMALSKSSAHSDTPFPP